MSRCRDALERVSESSKRSNGLTTEQPILQSTSKSTDVLLLDIANIYMTPLLFSERLRQDRNSLQNLNKKLSYYFCFLQLTE